jgi:hypothetical protein
MQLITNAELEESPLYVPSHDFEGLREINIWSLALFD